MRLRAVSIEDIRRNGALWGGHGVDIGSKDHVLSTQLQADALRRTDVDIKEEMFRGGPDIRMRAYISVTLAGG